MSDKMTIVARDGTPKYQIGDSNQVENLQSHEHLFDVAAFCLICRKTRAQIRKGVS